jgi:hypothetical protein
MKANIQLILVLWALAYQQLHTGAIYLQPEDMPDAEDYDEEDTWEEGLTELDRQKHVDHKDEVDLIEDEDDSFVDELDEEE